MKKTFTALMLAMLLILQPVMPISAAKTSDLSDWEYADAVKLFNDIGLYESADAEKSKSVAVSRADFALYAARMTGFDSNSKSDVRYFADVPMEHWAQSSINYLVECGAVSVSENKLFRPDDTVKPDEAVKIIVTLLGYGRYAELSGGFPTGYYKAARTADLDTFSSDTVTFADCTLFFLSAMRAKFNDISGVEDGNVIYDNDTDKTLFSVYWDIYEYSGRLNAVRGASLIRGFDADEDSVRVGDELFKTDGVDYSDSFGCEVIVFYEKKNGSSTKTVIHLYSDMDNNRICDVDAEDFDSFSSEYKFNYYKDDKEYSLTVSKNASILKNGKMLDSGISAAFSDDNDFYRLIDSDSDGKYETVLIYDYTAVYVSSKDSEKNIIYDKISSSSIQLTDEFRIIGTDGSELEFDRINNGDILNIFASDSYMTIYVTNNPVTGKITGVSKSEKEIVIGDARRKMQSEFWDKYESELNIGSEYVFYTDKYGYIVYAEHKNGGKTRFGYLIKSALSNDLDKCLMFKIFSEDGEMLSLKCADKVETDGEKYNRENVEAALCNANDGRLTQIIRFETDSDGNIDFIDTKKKGDKESDYSLSHTFTGTSMMYTAGLVNRFGAYGLCRRTALGFIVPPADQADTASDDMYYIMPQSYLSTSIRAQKVDLYSVDSSDPFAAAAVIEESGKVLQESTQFSVIKSISRKMTPDGDDLEAITVFDSSESEYYVDSSLKLSDLNIGEGDAVRIGTNSKGYVNQIDILFHYTAGDTVPVSPILWTGYTFAEDRITFGHVVYKKDRIIQWGYDTADTVSEAVEIPKDLPIIVCDETRRKDKVYIGTIDDIRDFKTSGNSASTILAHERFGEPKRLVVYKNGIR